MNWLFKMSTRELYKGARLAKEYGIKALYDDYVREIRRRRRPVSDEVVVKEYSDTSWLIRLPLGDFSTREAAEAEAEERRLERPNSPYDCTGQLFTQWQEAHFLGGQWWLWQSNAIDV